MKSDIQKELISNLKQFWKKNGENFNIISVFLVGSFSDGYINKLSDIDLVVIGDNKNHSLIFKELQKEIRLFFQEKYNINPVLFAEPVFEDFYFLNNDIPKFPLIHLIYHPIDRFNNYKEEKDTILLSWKHKYKMIFGNDVLKDMDYDISQNLESLNYFINGLIQTIQNLFIISDIEKHYLFYLKTYLSCISKFTEELPLYSVENATLNLDLLITQLNDNKKNVLANLNDKAYLEKRIIEFENNLLKIKETLS